MTTWTPEHTKRSLWVFITVAAIYATIPVARPILNFLKEYTVFPVLLTYLFCVVAVFFGYFLIAKLRLRKPLTYLLILGLIFLYVVFFAWKSAHPEERIHFLEYSLLGFLILRLCLLNHGNFASYLLAALIVTGFGAMDEVIQYFTPRRIFDVQDILINSIGGIMGLLWGLILSYEIKIK